VAWAKAHGVRPPQFVLAAADREQQATQCDSRTVCSKCSTHAKAASERKFDPSPAASKVRVVNGVRRNLRDQHANTTLVIGVIAQECQGQGWGWHSLPWLMLPESLTELIKVDIPRERYSPSSDSCLARSLKPPVPPPRRTSVAILGV
jgi:hypothetical protein